MLWEIYVAVFSALENGDRYHRFWPTYSIKVIAEGKIKGRDKGKRWVTGYFLTSIEQVGQKQ